MGEREKKSTQRGEKEPKENKLDSEKKRIVLARKAKKKEKKINPARGEMFEPERRRKTKT